MNTLPDIEKDFAQWYQDIIYQAELVDQAPVRGCFIIRPYGWAMWENMQQYMDARIKATGHQNASFPLFIPQSFIAKEAKHVEGFSPELAVVTHAGGKQLEEPLVVRPTSETIIHDSFSRWVRSWRDLPLKLNQWCNVVRWEKRPRAFLRTTEFFWQEGHTVHETLQEAETEVQLMLNEYVSFIQGQLSIPVFVGEKSASERFAGAERTYAVEGIMPDGRALQMCTSHLLSQSFAHAFNIKFQNREGEQAYPYLTSWGITTRVVGATIMTHGDQKGLVLPPAIAPIQVVVVAIFKNDEEYQAVANELDFIQSNLADWRVFSDLDRQKTPGAKFYHWELRGVPVRLEIGPRDAKARQVVLVNRFTGQKTTVPFDQITQVVAAEIKNIQDGLYKKAQERLERLVIVGQKLTEFGPQLEERGVACVTGWCQSPECEQALAPYKASTRVLLDTQKVTHCFNCSKPSPRDVLIARSY